MKGHLNKSNVQKNFGKRTKSGIMVGLGETKDEVLQVMDDLANMVVMCLR
jgi:lipoate synthase